MLRRIDIGLLENESVPKIESKLQAPVRRSSQRRLDGHRGPTCRRRCDGESLHQKVEKSFPLDAGHIPDALHLGDQSGTYDPGWLEISANFERLVLGCIENI